MINNQYYLRLLELFYDVNQIRFWFAFLRLDRTKKIDL